MAAARFFALLAGLLYTMRPLGVLVVVLGVTAGQNLVVNGDFSGAWKYRFDSVLENGDISTLGTAGTCRANVDGWNPLCIGGDAGRPGTGEYLAANGCTRSTPYTVWQPTPTNLFPAEANVTYRFQAWVANLNKLAGGPWPQLALYMSIGTGQSLPVETSGSLEPGCNPGNVYTRTSSLILPPHCQSELLIYP